MLLIVHGAIVIRTHVVPPKPTSTPILHTIFGPEYYIFYNYPSNSPTGARMCTTLGGNIVPVHILIYRSIYETYIILPVMLVYVHSRT